jgi:NADH:ubiquinone oxidoreductase subunit 4 (subunit M)
MYVPAILAAWGIVVTGVYLLRTVKDAFFGKMSARWEGLEDARTPLQKMPYALLVAVLLFFGFWPQPLLTVIRQGVEPIAGFVARERGEAVSRGAAPPASPPEAPPAPAEGR